MPLELLIAFIVALLPAAAQGQSNAPSRVPAEDVLRPLSTSRRTANGAEPPRSNMAVRSQSEPEKLTWQLDDPTPMPARTRLAPVHVVADPDDPPRQLLNLPRPLPNQPCQIPSAGSVRTASHRYPVRQAHGEQELQFAPAGEIVREPTPLEMQPVEMMEQVPPQPSAPYDTPSRPRSFISNVQPKKASAAPDFKCPTREELMKPICELGVDITPKQGDVPQECPLLADGYEGRCWCDSLYMWKAASLCHKPLYFEDVGLERYGHTWHPFLQPFVSGAHFFGTLPILPYKMGIEPPGECIYALGYYRPGDCAPKMLYCLPLSLRGAVYQAAAVTGAVYVLP